MKMILANTIETLEKRQKKLSDCKEMIRRCGANTGNVCFVDALFEQIKYEEEVDCLQIDGSQEDDLFVLPASNWINEDGKVLHRIFLRLEKSDARLLVIGIGVQMDLHERVSDFVKKLSPKTIAALKIMGEHSVSIGVRGAATAEVLDKLSIHNWQIIGCPSFYEPYRKYKTIKLSKASCDNIVFNTTPGAKNEHRMIKMAMSANAPIVLQAMSDLPLTLIGKSIKKADLDSKYPGLNVEVHEYESYLQKNGHIFYNRKDWSDYLLKSGISLSVGGRFHGNMMAFSNGIPAVWIVHDKRTEELVQAMRLPFIFSDDLTNIDNLQPDILLEHCNFYNEEFTQHYKRMSEDYVEFLEKNGVNHSFNR